VRRRARGGRGILQHIEEAGIHSGDSAAVLPPYRRRRPEHLDEMRDIARRLALRLGVVGLMNVQFAIHEGEVYVIEVNPRASRTVPFIAKAVGLPLVAGAELMAGRRSSRSGFTRSRRCRAVLRQGAGLPLSTASPASTRCSDRR
jgi:carbamoyl-phosphate synthase large subunit